MRLGGADVADALILGRGRPFAPGTGHSEAASLDFVRGGAAARFVGR